jgi:hypothetical protein
MSGRKLMDLRPSRWIYEFVFMIEEVFTFNVRYTAPLIQIYTWTV